MPISVQTRTIGADVTVLSIVGRMHLGTQLQDLEETVKKLVAGGCRKLVLDLSQVEYVDSAAIGMLMMANGSIQEAGGKMHIAGANERVLTTMRIAHADQVLSMVADVEAAGTF